MKTSLPRFLLNTVFGLGATIACLLPAQTPAPTPPSGGTPGRTTAPQSPATGTNATNQRKAGQPTTPARSGAQPNQPAQPTPGQPKQPTPATTTRPTDPQQPGTQTVAPGTTAPGTTTPGTTAPGTQTVAPGTTTPGTQTVAPGTTTSGTTSPGTTTSRTGTALPAGSTTLQDGTVTTSGMIGTFDGNAFTLQTDTAGTAAPANFLIGPGTMFVDVAGNPVPRERIFRAGNRAPVSVFYTQANDGSLMASKVVVNEQIVNDPIVAAGTITEVSPGILVIESPGASSTPVRYVNNKTTNYVNENGEPIPPESVKAGTPVRIFYTKVGDTLVASKVEVTSRDKSALPAPPLDRGTTKAPKVQD